MKIFIRILLILSVFTILISSCNPGTRILPDETSISPGSSGDLSSDISSNQDDPLTADMFFVYKDNTKYVYEGIGNEFASFTVNVDFKTADTVQTRTNNGGTEIVRVIINSGSKISVIREEPEIYFRENFLEGDFADEEILIMEPVIVGTKWDIKNNRERFISAIDKEITTPYGSFKALEITTVSKGSDSDIVLDYYVKDIGHIKTIFRSNEGSSEEFEIISQLSRILENQKHLQDVDFYFPDFENEVLIVETRQLEFETNDSTLVLIEENFKNFPDGKEGKLLSENTKINFITRKTNEIAHIDFSEEFISEMNVGAGFEVMIIQSIVNTVSGYYGVEKVYISVDGSPYSSGHIAISEDEFFTRN